MRSTSYSNSVYSPSYSSFKNSSFLKLQNQPYRPTVSLFSNDSSTSRAPSTVEQISSTKDFKVVSYGKDYQKNKTSASYSPIISDGTQSTQAKPTTFSLETNASSTKIDKYTSPSTSKFSSPVSKNENKRTYTTKRRGSLNQDGFSKEDSSRFTSNQKWPANERATLSRSKSVEPNSKRYQENAFASRKSSDLTSYYPDKRSNSIHYPYIEDRDINSTCKSFPFSSPNICSSPCDNPATRKDYRVKEDLNNEIINQQEFFQRLSRAHNIVDELLKSRGLKFEEEPKFYRRWEPAEMIQEEILPSPARRSSNASDSGLSLDTESENSSNSELSVSPSVPPMTKTDNCNKTFVKSPQNEYVLIVRLWNLFKEVAFTTIAPVKKPLKKASLVENPSTSDSYVENTKKQKFCAKNENIEKKLIEEKNSRKKISLPKNKSQKQYGNGKLQNPKFPTNVNSINKNEKTFSNQLLTFARYFRKKNTLARSSAEISIQHVSFYQVAQSLIERQKPVERSVRIHLRLTERAPTSSQVATVLFIRKRVIHISSDVISISKKEYRKNDPTLSRLRSTVPVFARKQEKINPIRIPENFLKVLNPTAKKISRIKEPEPDSEIRVARGNLRRVPFNKTVSGANLAVYMIRNQRYSFTTPDHPLDFFRINTVRNNTTNDSKTDNENRNGDIKILEVKSNLSKKCEIANEKKKGNEQKNFEVSRKRVVTSAGEADALKFEASKITTNAKNSNCVSFDEFLKRPVVTRNHVSQTSAGTYISSPKIFPMKKVENDFGVSTFSKLTTRVHNNEKKIRPKKISSKYPNLKNNRDLKINSDNVSFESNTQKLKQSSLVSTWISPQVKMTKKLSLFPTFNVSFRKIKINNQKVKTNITETGSSAPPNNPTCTDEEVEEDERNLTVQDNESEEEIRIRNPKLLDTSETMTEAEKAMLAARQRQEKDQAAKLLDYEEYRRVEREKEEEELRALKEKQERRRLEREREEKEFAIRQELEEKRRRQEEEERKARVEADRKKKEQEKKKRALLSQTTFNVVTNGQIGGRNFVITSKTDRADKFGNIVQAKQEMGMTKEQQEEAKRNYLSTVARSIDIPANDVTSLKEKIRILHQKICRLEADKYDLEKRQERQEYDLRELNERQRQVARNKALKKGLDPADSNSSRYPPKVSIISKYDRQSDRRNFAERRAVFESKNAFPCFPNVPPPQTVYEKVILKLDNDNEEEDDDVSDYEDEEDE